MGAPKIKQIDAGLKSRTQALAERGYDAEQVDAEIAADRAREQPLGLAGRFRVSELSQTLLRQWIRTQLAKPIYPS
jgi:capsid protein